MKSPELASISPKGKRDIFQSGIVYTFDFVYNSRQKGIEGEVFICHY